MFVRVTQGFSCRGTELESKWAKIPSGVDILLSHMPPYNVLDLAFDPGSTAKDNPCPVCRETHRRQALVLFCAMFALRVSLTYIHNLIVCTAPTIIIRLGLSKIFIVPRF